MPLQYGVVSMLFEDAFHTMQITNFCIQVGVVVFGQRAAVTWQNNFPLGLIKLC